MKNDYSYLDPDCIYTDAKTGVLYNLGSITKTEDETTK